VHELFHVVDAHNLWVVPRGHRVRMSAKALVAMHGSCKGPCCPTATNPYIPDQPSVPTQGLS
jgi:hypothetical protein